MNRKAGQQKRSYENRKIMREPDRGEHFAGTRDGGSLADARPLGRRHFIPREVLVKAFAGVPPIDYEQFRAEIDAHVDSDPTPRDWPEP